MSQERTSLILHVITGLEDGGAEGALYRLCKFDRVNRHVVVSLLAGGKYVEPLKELGVQVHSLEMDRGRFSLTALLALRRLIRRYRPDTVQTWLYHSDLIGGLASRLAGAEQVVWGIRHATLIPGKVKRSTILTARICAMASRFIPDKIICCSYAAEKVHVGLGYDASKFWIIPNGYDLASLTPDAAARTAFRRELQLPDDLPLLGMVSRFDPQKDHENLLDALALLSAQGLQFRCALVGTGMDEGNARLMQLVRERELSDHVILLGRRTDIPRVMNGLDLHLLSSVSEAFPNVLAEAMACGTPCVSTDVGDAAFIVGATGWIVPPEDSLALASAAAEALQEIERPMAWGQRQSAARERVKTYFEIGEVVDAYLACWSASKPQDRVEA